MTDDVQSDDVQPDDVPEPIADGAVRLKVQAVRASAALADGVGDSEGTTGTADDAPVDDDPMALLDDLDWRPSYDRESVEAYLAAVEEEKARLLAEIEAAEERVAAAEARCATATTEQSAERDAVLGELMLAARAEMDRVEAEQRALVSAIQALADDQAAGIAARAAADAAAVSEVVASLAALDDDVAADVADDLDWVDEPHDR